MLHHIEKGPEHPDLPADQEPMDIDFIVSLMKHLSDEDVDRDSTRIDYDYLNNGKVFTKYAINASNWNSPDGGLAKVLAWRGVPWFCKNVLIIQDEAKPVTEHYCPFHDPFKVVHQLDHPGPEHNCHRDKVRKVLHMDKNWKQESQASDGKLPVGDAKR